MDMGCLKYSTIRQFEDLVSIRKHEKAIKTLGVIHDSYTQIYDFVQETATTKATVEAVSFEKFVG